MMQQVSTLLVIASLFLSSSTSSMAFQKKSDPKNPDHKGTATVVLRYIKALNQTGAPDPAHDKDCRARFGTLLEKKVVTGLPATLQPIRRICI
jgi:hypothetical protein